MALTRRFFLGTAPAAAAVGILGSTVATTAEAAIKWDETYNVVVIGAGGAGLTAPYPQKKLAQRKLSFLKR